MFRIEKVQHVQREQVCSGESWYVQERADIFRIEKVCSGESKVCSGESRYVQREQVCSG